MNKLFELKTILKTFWLPITILLIHAILSYFKIYILIWWIDIPMHFAGGVSIGISYFLFIKIIQEEGYLGKTHELILFIFVISMIEFTVVVWEFFEFSLDYLFQTNAQPSLANTIQDMFLGITGGLLGYFIAKRI